MGESTTTTPVTTTLNQLLLDAIKRRSSDIHIEPGKTLCRIRFRIDGVLQVTKEIPAEEQNRLISRIKIMAQIDIAQKRLPQDGHFQHDFLRRAYDFRVSTCPVIHGEKIVIRVLQDQPQALTIEKLGMEPEQVTLVQNVIKKPQGLILVTGPTGSGKTNTLYSLLKAINSPEKNIVTVEDPVEIQLEGINQLNIKPKAGLTFATALRAFLRQDPDVIMVGEIRDPETATIAVRAAQTGHLVLSTLHCNSPLEALVRLKTLGVAPNDLGFALSLIVSQRLLRKICEYCHAQKECEHCLNGYRGRTGIFECLHINDHLKNAIINSASVELSHSHQDLKTMAQLKITQQITSIAEAQRVIYYE